MEKINWIKELVRSEQQMEDSSLIDLNHGYDQDRILAHETLRFMMELKTEFVDTSSAFNELKNSPLGRIKVYGIAKTHADFMLFRNGYKMIFSLKEPGRIGIRFDYIGNNYIPGAGSALGSEANQVGTQIFAEQFIITRWGPFNEVVWTFEEQPFKRDYLVRYYISQFLKLSTK